MSLHITNPLIMPIQCARNVVFIHKFSKQISLPSHTLPPLDHFTPLLWPPLTNPGCTTVTGIAKMHKAPCSPLIGVKEMFKRGKVYGIGTYTTLHNYPLIMSFSVEENAVFIHEFSTTKNLPTVGGGSPSHTVPPRSLPRILPPPKIKSWLRHWGHSPETCNQARIPF